LPATKISTRPTTPQTRLLASLTNTCLAKNRFLQLKADGILLLLLSAQQLLELLQFLLELLALLLTLKMDSLALWSGLA